MSVKEKRREEIRKKRKNEIADAAMRVFLKKGFRNTSMEDIINETSLSKGGFYYYFKSTKEILLAMMEEEILLELKEIGEKFNGFSSTRIEDYVVFIIDYLINRVFRKKDENTIMTMLYGEMPYDSDYLEFFNRSQMRGVLGIIAILRHYFPDIPHNDVLVPRLIFLGQYLNGMALVMSAFDARESFEVHLPYIRRVFLGITADMFELNDLERV